MLCYILDIVYNFFPNGWVRFAFDVTQPNLDSDGAIYKEINTVIRRELRYDIKGTFSRFM